MKLTAFRAAEGDSLLLESADGHRLLMDGGTTDAYATNVAPALGRLRGQGKDLDLVCVTHVDADHISGVLKLLDDEAAWRVHDHQVATGNADHPRPAADRPAQVRTLLHNAFGDLIGTNRGEIRDMLAASATLLSAAEDDRLAGIAEGQRDLAASIPQALRVSRRIRADQLDIPLNPQFGGKLALVADGTPDFGLGSVRLKLIGPFPQDVDKLRREWNVWLRAHQQEVRTLRTRGRARHGRPGRLRGRPGARAAVPGGREPRRGRAGAGVAAGPAQQGHGAQPGVDHVPRRGRPAPRCC